MRAIKYFRSVDNNKATVQLEEYSCTDTCIFTGLSRYISYLSQRFSSCFALIGLNCCF